MANINENFLNLKESYLFAEISKRVIEYTAANPDKKVIRLGIGDVTLPIAPVVVEAIKKAADEMGVKETFRGYCDYNGYEFIREAVSGYYKGYGVEVSAEEVFISDGAKSDVGNIVDIFSNDSIVMVTDPVYPVYVDTNIMSGRKLIYANSTEENGFAALPDKNVKTDIIYLCSPNNPTGSVYSKEQLKKWVDYALENKAIILFDAAYEAFIDDDSLPRSIFAIEGARDCAIEFCSLSKTAGFTGTRCGYTVIPKSLTLYSANKDAINTELKVWDLWYRRQGTKFNGVSYPIQRGAEAVFTEIGLKQTKDNILYYKENAKLIAKAMDSLNIKYTGGINSPYIWLKCPNNMSSWEFFDYLLNNIQVVGTPGEGFGNNGAGWFRLTAFGDRANTITAMERFTELYKK